MRPADTALGLSKNGSGVDEVGKLCVEKMAEDERHTFTRTMPESERKSQLQLGGIRDTCHVKWRQINFCLLAELQLRMRSYFWGRKNSSFPHPAH